MGRCVGNIVSYFQWQRGWSYCSCTGENSVYTDNYYGALTAVNHLISLGHTRIAYIVGNMSIQAGSLKYKAYRGAQEEASIAFDKVLIVDGEFTENSGKVGTEELLKKGDYRTNIFAPNDRMALAAISVLSSSGLKILNDVSIVGFDNIEVASYSVPKMTTVKHPVFDGGVV